MKRLKRGNLILAAIIAGLYVGTALLGMQIRGLGLPWPPVEPSGIREWEAPSTARIPEEPKGESIRRGLHLFDDTALYAPKFTSSKVSCGSCHAASGIQPYASPMVGLPRLFPMYNKRAGHVISLRDRIEECFVRSENGRPLPYDSAEMQGIVDYIEWLSRPQPEHLAFVGRGLMRLPELKPNAEHGSMVYAAQCAGCHGTHGEGMAPVFPPLWGPQSFNDGAGMNEVQKMAAFVQHNMPQNRMGTLSAQQAYDVAAFIHEQKRPAFDQEYSRF